jgi:hypothetical protein
VTWFAIGMFGAGITWLLWSSLGFHREDELGAVSSQWLAEYRQNHES